MLKVSDGRMLPAADAVKAARVHRHVAGRHADVLPLELPHHLQPGARMISAQRHNQPVWAER